MPITVQLPDGLGDFLRARALAEGHASMGDYVASVLMRLEKESRRAEFEAKIMEGLEELNRGEKDYVTPEEWEELRAEIRSRYGDGE
jgi:hypothetical protein